MPAVRKQPFHSSCRWPLPLRGLIRRTHWWMTSCINNQSLTWTFSHVYISGFPSLHWNLRITNINREIQIWLDQLDGIIEVRQWHTQGRYQRHCVVRQLYDAQVSLRWTWSKWSSSPPQKAGSRLSLHTHQPGRPTNDKSKLFHVC